MISASQAKEPPEIMSDNRFEHYSHDELIQHIKKNIDDLPYYFNRNDSRGARIKIDMVSPAFEELRNRIEAADRMDNPRPYRR